MVRKNNGMIASTVPVSLHVWASGFCAAHHRPSHERPALAAFPDVAPVVFCPASAASAASACAANRTFTPHIRRGSAPGHLRHTRLRRRRHSRHGSSIAGSPRRSRRWYGSARVTQPAVPQQRLHCHSQRDHSLDVRIFSGGSFCWTVGAAPPPLKLVAANYGPRKGSGARA